MFTLRFDYICFLRDEQLSFFIRVSHMLLLWVQISSQPCVNGLHFENVRACLLMSSHHILTNMTLKVTFKVGRPITEDRKDKVQLRILSLVCFSAGMVRQREACVNWTLHRLFKWRGGSAEEGHRGGCYQAAATSGICDQPVNRPDRREQAHFRLG